jgi:SNF2 family DNA or RNA helicase
LPPPPALQATLRPYQVRGFSWLAGLVRLGLGACLADDMGLGKTIQTIALLLHRRAGAPALLVCPTSVVGNWRREIARFAPNLRVLVHQGPQRAAGPAFAAAARAHDLVITSFSLLARDEAGLQAVAWAGLILDEAQNIKNPDAAQTRSARRLRAGYRVALTGTPVENRLQELWSIMDFLNPGFLGDRESFRAQ